MSFEYEITRAGCHPSVRVRLNRPQNDTNILLTCHYGVTNSIALEIEDKKYLDYFKAHPKAYYAAVEELASSWATYLDQRAYLAFQAMDNALDDDDDSGDSDNI